MMIIGIAGGSGAGKTTVARTITERFGKENIDYLSQDWYYKDLSHLSMEERENQNLDHPDAFDNPLLVEHLERLRQGKSIDIPFYDYKERIRLTKTMTMQAKSIAILEGILVLAIPELRAMIDLKIFVDADADIRLIRRINRDIEKRGWEFDEIIVQYLRTVKPMHDAFIEPSKRYADIIVPRGGENVIATDLLGDLLEHYAAEQSNEI